MLCRGEKQFTEWFTLTRYGRFKMVSIIQKKKLIEFSCLEKGSSSTLKTFHIHSLTSLVFYTRSWFQTFLSEFCCRYNTLSIILPAHWFCSGCSCTHWCSYSCSSFSLWEGESGRGYGIRLMHRAYLSDVTPVTSGKLEFSPLKWGWLHYWVSSWVGGAIIVYNMQVSRRENLI